MAKLSAEIEELFHDVRCALGAPVRSVELTTEQLCSLLKQAIGDYSERVGNWAIENQWMTLYGKNISSLDMGFSMSVKTFDLSKNFANWFSKEVGLQQEGPWELKKDFFMIERGKQVYTVPAGRTINKVLWITPSSTQAALYASYGGFDMGFAGGYGQIGNGAIGGFYVLPAADIAYMAADFDFKNKMVRSDLVYQVTAGPEGTHLIHLMSTPGSRLYRGVAPGYGGLWGLDDCACWYTYYDTATASDVDDCVNAHPGDVIISPEQVPMKALEYSTFNDPTKQTIRQLLIAKAKELLGLIRGKYSGKVNIPQAEMTMDYAMFSQAGKDEYNRIMDNLDKRLDRMSPANLMKTQADMMKSSKEILDMTPLDWLVM